MAKRGLVLIVLFAVLAVLVGETFLIVYLASDAVFNEPLGVILAVIALSIVGIKILRSRMANVMAALQGGSLPGFIIGQIGAALLVFPGFVTAVLGGLLLLPPMQKVLAAAFGAFFMNLMRKQAENMMRSGKMPGGFGGGANPFAGGQNPFAGGQNPFAGGQNPFAGGQNPFAGGQNPFANGQNPFAAFGAPDAQVRKGRTIEAKKS